MRTKVQARYVIPLISVGAALIVSQAVLANDPSQDRSRDMNSDRSMQGSQSSSDIQHASGTVRSIDTSTGTVTVKGTILSKTFHADASTLQGLSVGDKVDITYTQQGDNLVASQITRSSSSSGSQSSPSDRSPSSPRSSSPSPEPGSSSQLQQP